MILNIKGQDIVIPEDAGFDETSLLELGEDVVNGNVPVYILSSPDDEAFFFSKSPINIKDLRKTFSTDEFLLGREE